MTHMRCRILEGMLGLALSKPFCVCRSCLEHLPLECERHAEVLFDMTDNPITRVRLVLCRKCAAREVQKRTLWRHNVIPCFQQSMATGLIP